MLQNQNLVNFAKYISDLLVSDGTLQEYCDTKFGKPLSVVIAPPDHYQPTDDDTPIIFLHDLQKNEGATQHQCQYALIVSIMIHTEDDVITTEAGSKVMSGTQYISDIMSLVQEVVNADCKAPSNVEGSTPSLVGANPYSWIGFLYLEWDVDIPLGGTNYF